MEIRYVLAAAAFAFCGGVSAQTLKPGLWEVTNDMKGGGQMEKAQIDIQKQMANMTPEQKKMMQDAMAKQGMQMSAPGPGGGMAVRTCMTKEMIDRNELPSQQGNCKTTKQQKSGNTMSFAVVCTQPPSTGEGQVVVTSAESYTMKMAVNSSAGGKPQTMNVEGRGKWLSADCGPAARK